MTSRTTAAVRTEFPRTVREIENVWIPLADGTRLAARIWLPTDAELDAVPAILEYLPYRKDDGTALADALQHPYFAGHGYASVRVDLRGTGDSDGLLLGEYLKQEQDDALEVVRWLAEQPWCTGAVGMIGYSWGGFNGLQVAALRPEQLKAVITVASTDDRYLDDCHYMGGCLLASDMLKWSASMLAYAIQPPDPRFVGDTWRAMWLERLENAPELARDWVAHQRRDEFWRHGSIAEDYSAVECPVMAVGGWADAYVNAVPRLLEHLSVPKLGIIGPWGHMMPHTGVPGPAIGFLQEALRWWDTWLKGIDTGIMHEPALRAWLQDPVAPASFHAEWPGRWVAIPEWPAPQSHGPERFALRADNALVRVSGHAAAIEDPAELVLLGHQQCGEAAGVWCANGLPDEIAGDQGPDDALSLVFTTRELAEQLEVFGSPVVRLRLSADKPWALVSARLEDVSPAGESLLVSWGLLNLTHRDSHECPAPLEVGREYDVTLRLRACGHRFAAGHRIRLALTPTYWPHAWPSPEAAALSVCVGASSLELPVAALDRASTPEFAVPETAPPLPEAPGDGAGRTRVVSVDPATGRHVIRDEQRVRSSLPGGERRVEFGTDTYSIVEGEPVSAVVHCMREVSSARPGREWSIRVEAEMTCDAGSFLVSETFSASEAGDELFSAERRHWIPRDFV